MADRYMAWLAQAFPIRRSFAERIDNEMTRMAVDTDQILAEWSTRKKRSVFAKPFKNIFRADMLQGENVIDMCTNAVNLGGYNYLFECIHLSDFEMGERLRQSKVNMMSKLVSRETFFRNVTNFREEKKEPVPMAISAPLEHNDSLETSLLSLPLDLIWQVFQKCNYRDAQNLALTCKFVNGVFRHRNATMLLPDLTLLLDFSTNELRIRFWKGTNRRRQKVLDLADVKNRKNAILYNTTQLRIETSGDFKEQDLLMVKNYTTDRKFKRVVVKAAANTTMVRRMVELFDLDSAELEINRLLAEPFPKIKTISIRECLLPELGERLFAAKHFHNISCILHNIDTLRKSLAEWDRGDREIGRWLISKPFTIFQTPFGRRHRSPNAGGQQGHLFFYSEHDTRHSPHGELTEYRFQATS